MTDEVAIGFDVVGTVEFGDQRCHGRLCVGHISAGEIGVAVDRRRRRLTREIGIIKLLPG